MRLVGNHNDVATVGKDREVAARVPVLLAQSKLLHRREYDAAGRFRPEHAAEVLPRGRLHGCLRQGTCGGKDLIVELVIEIVAVG